MLVIHILNVSKAYNNGVKALSDITIRITRGEFVFLVGPSGAGKTTLMRLLLREELPTRGQIMIDGKNVTRIRRSEIPGLRRKLGVIFQDFRLLPERTVFENVAFALEVIERPAKEIQKRVPAVLETVGLLNKAKHFPYQLSGGEQQRVAIARAVINKPAMVIADEPTGNLDRDTAWGIVNLLEQINKSGSTIVMATHNQEIVDAMQKRVIALDRGMLVRDEERGAYRREA
jgi:cell division transport system ATP-binding protein